MVNRNKLPMAMLEKKFETNQKKLDLFPVAGKRFSWTIPESTLAMMEANSGPVRWLSSGATAMLHPKIYAVVHWKTDDRLHHMAFGQQKTSPAAAVTIESTEREFKQYGKLVKRYPSFIEHKFYLKSDRSSCNSFYANQFRLFLHSIAYYVLLHTMQKQLFKGTEFENAGWIPKVMHHKRTAGDSLWNAKFAKDIALFQLPVPLT